jgi:hypothetical protein
MRPMLALVWIASAALSTACANAGTLQRRLLITEVGRNQVELYLDEPASDVLVLGNGFELEVRTDDGAGNATHRSTGLGAGDQRIPGGGFFVVWEDTGYQGPPVAEPFSGGQTGYVPGIKVEHGLLNGIKDFPSEVRVHGSRNRINGVVIVLPRQVTDEADDVVRFGTPAANRPTSGGAFTSTDTLGNPSGSNTLQRLFTNGAPRDTNDESDWTRSASSWGVPTP